MKKHLFYPIIMSFTLLLVACGGGGGDSSSSSTPGTLSTTSANALPNDCLIGGTTNPSTYSGSGVGVCQYSNTTASSKVINLAINGVSSTNTVTLLFSNGSTSDQASLSAGTASPNINSNYAKAVVASAEPETEEAKSKRLKDEFHENVLKQNEEIARNLLKARDQSSAKSFYGDFIPQPSSPLASPALGAARVWIDTFTGSVINYSTTAQKICSLPNGRNIVFWADSASLAGNYVSSASITSLANAVCGQDGGFDRLTTLLGDVWGTHNYSNLILDSAKQDINILIVKPNKEPAWAGYYYCLNSFTDSIYSNQALVFFTSAYQLNRDINFLLSTLIHEATHMINYYQRVVARGAVHDTWLEETSALMSEDVVAASFIKNSDGSVYNEIQIVEIPSYLATGGNFSYTNWQFLNGPSYAIGGSFGAYLNRNYGTAIMTGLINSCPGSTAGSSYPCMEKLIQKNGGSGFSEDFARMGASVFGLLPSSGLPSGYGFPAKTTGKYSLVPIDLSTKTAPSTTPSNGSTILSTSHTYKRDGISAGKNSWSRTGIVVPANTSVKVVVR